VINWLRKRRALSEVDGERRLCAGRFSDARPADEIAEKIQGWPSGARNLKGEDHVIRRLVNLGWSPAEIKDAKENGAPDGVVLAGIRPMRRRRCLGGRGSGAINDGRMTRTGIGSITVRVTASSDSAKRMNPILNNGWTVDKDWEASLSDTSERVSTQGKTAWKESWSMELRRWSRREPKGFTSQCRRVRSEVAVLTDNDQALRAAIQRREKKTTATELWLLLPNARSRFRAKAYEFMKRVRRPRGQCATKPHMLCEK